MEIILNNISKSFGSNEVIKNFNFLFEKKSYGIIGKNGSGKSTLLKLIGNLILPTQGNIKYNFNKRKDILKHMFFCAPYQDIISELTVKEFLLFHMKFRKLKFNINEVLDIFKLEKYNDTKIENLSSGTIQKIKLMITFYSDSDFILLDEPTTNLDDEGKKIYFKLMEQFSIKKGIIVATNDKKDIIIDKKNIINLT